MLKTDSNKSNEGNVDGDHQCNHSLRRLTKLIPSLSVLLKDLNNENTEQAISEMHTQQEQKFFRNFYFKKISAC